MFEPGSNQRPVYFYIDLRFTISILFNGVSYYTMPVTFKLAWTQMLPRGFDGVQCHGQWRHYSYSYLVLYE